jgi:hypothetical protein
MLLKERGVIVEIKEIIEYMLNRFTLYPTLIIIVYSLLSLSVC